MSEVQEKTTGTGHWRMIALYMMIYDIVVVNLSYFFGLLLRFDMHYTSIPGEYMHAFLKFAPVYTVFTILVFLGLHLYNSLWQYASYSELNRVALASVITTAFQVIGSTLFAARMPVAYYIVGAGLQFLSVLAVRFGYRYINLERNKRKKAQTIKHNVMVIGAGAAGQVILRELRDANEMEGKAFCIIDDDPNKWNRSIDGVPIVGGRDHILSAAEKYNIDMIMFAIPTASVQDKRDILNICKETKCELKSLPGIYQIAKGDVALSKMKPVAIEDLLGRDPIKVNMDEIFQYIKGKTVLITGGGGSIGSELARQIASHDPKRLILFDVYENNTYDIQLELKKKYPELDLVTLIGSVRDSRKMFWLFETYRPDIVYHAAAHKHVPLMEDSPCEAIKNNAIGTYKTAYAAMVYGCKRFVLISTDKAVNPTNIMGASKRLCEMILQSFDYKIKQGKAEEIPQLFTHWTKSKINTPEIQDALKHAHTEFVAVRFGNVLGSSGSVIPLFKKQIEAGGPVTVTHPDIIRFFMTIPEAVSLVLQAGTYAHGGEIFVLDMGEPVKIDTLARNLIRLSGYTPDVDIKVVYSGLRPGEKLYEEKLMAEEGLTKTENKLIHIGKPIAFDMDEFLGELDGLMEAAYKNRDDMKLRVKGIVGTYHPEV